MSFLPSTICVLDIVQLLMLTEPDKWTPHAVYAVTRVFASNLNALRAQRCVSLFLTLLGSYPLSPGLSHRLRVFWIDEYVQILQHDSAACCSGGHCGAQKVELSFVPSIAKGSLQAAGVFQGHLAAPC